MLTAVAGINWGDEGKGRMVDMFADDYDIICRYQGGNNAGHTVVSDRGKFVFNLLPSGILHSGVVNVMGGGMVIDLEHLCGEINSLTARGVRLTPDNLKISSNAFICMPYHRMQDVLEEDRLGDNKYGSTRRGIAPVYGDKYMKKGMRMGDLLDKPSLEKKLMAMLQWKNLTLCGYGAHAAQVAESMKWIEKHSPQLIEFIFETSEYMYDAAVAGKSILFEAQLGALRDIDYGIYPYTTSSQTLAGYAPIGAGIPGSKLDLVIGVMKAYSSCVGEGPFTAELSGKEGNELRNAGTEFGAATGRARRVGGFDVPASLYGVRIQGADEIALTKLDVLSSLDRIPVCVAYEIDGIKTCKFPTDSSLLRAKPVYEYMDGFKADISRCRCAEELPAAAMRYVRFLEEAVNCPIKYVSVGPKREDYITLA